MKYFGRWSMAMVVLCVGGLVAPAGAQQTQTPTEQKTPPAQTPPQPAPQQRNPFEDVPGNTAQPTQQQPAQPSPLETVPSAPGQPAPQLETPKQAPGAAQPAVTWAQAERLAKAWERRNRGAFLSGYLGVGGITELVPLDRAAVTEEVKSLLAERMASSS